MRRNSFQFRLLRATLGTVLALHLGLAQASMAQMGFAHVDSAAPCHAMDDASMAGMAMSGADAAGTAAASDAGHQTTSHEPCCAAGDCHCAAVSCLIFSVSARQIGVAEPTVAPRFMTHDIPLAVSARQFRPPIRN